jgi:hypothetical protein
MLNTRPPKPSIQESYCGVFILGGVVRVVWNDGICECRFLLYGNFPGFGGCMNGDVKEVYLVVCPAFCCKLLRFPHLQALTKYTCLYNVS